jgi:hypothetical protein
MILAELNAVDAVDHDHHHGVLHCGWKETLFDLTCSQFEFGELIPPTLQRLGTARLNCEYLEEQCLGILVLSGDLHSPVSYRVITNHSDELQCNASDVSPQIESVWLKNCSLVKLDNDDDDQFSPTRSKRSDAGSDEFENNSTTASASVFKSPDFEGSSMNISGAVDDVGDDWKDSIASISCDQCVIIVFELPDFAGRQLAIGDGTRSMDPFFRDHLGSIMVLPYEALSDLCFTVYTEANATFCGDQDLTETSWDGRVASMEIFCPDDCSVIVYDRVFTGRFQEFNSFAFDEDLEDVGEDWYNAIASIQIRPWTFEEGYEGQFEPAAIFYEDPQKDGASQSASGEIEVFASRMNASAS